MFLPLNCSVLSIYQCASRRRSCVGISGSFTHTHFRKCQCRWPIVQQTSHRFNCVNIEKNARCSAHNNNNKHGDIPVERTWTGKKNSQLQLERGHSYGCGSFCWPPMMRNRFIPSSSFGGHEPRASIRVQHHHVRLRFFLFQVATFMKFPAKTCFILFFFIPFSFEITMTAFVQQQLLVCCLSPCVCIAAITGEMQHVNNPRRRNPRPTGTKQQKLPFPWASSFFFSFFSVFLLAIKRSFQCI